jgi:hypothetical protein
MPRFWRFWFGPRHDQAPGDQRPGVAGPAGLNRQGPEVHVGRLDHPFLRGRGANPLRGHVQHLAEDRQGIPGGLESLRRIRLLQEGKQSADLAQGLDRLRPHPERDPFRGAEEIAEHRDLEALRVFEQQRRAAGPEHAVADLGHLEVRIDFLGDAPQFPARLQQGDEVAQVAVFDGLGHRRPRS